MVNNITYIKGAEILKNKIRIGIVGYGNLGKGAEIAIKNSNDMETVAIFSRRPAENNHKSDTKIIDINLTKDYVDSIDVMILCGGSSKDLPIQGPYFASLFSTVDGYDNHGNIPYYFESMNEASKAGGNTSIICAGWDPGLFSMNRVLFEAALPQGTSYTFWGPGVSQGHSDAIRRIPGVKNAIQYTIPDTNSVNKIKNGESPDLTNREKHKRECYVVAEEYADKEEITEGIVSMPNYFKDYDTKVFFITEEELLKNHSKMYHGGTVLRNGKTGINESMVNNLAFSLKLDSNSEFTASVLVAYARAAYRLNNEGFIGAKTVFDIPLKYITAKSEDELLKNYL